MFQHTAARRRLLSLTLGTKAFFSCFNTQPPEGGCLVHPIMFMMVIMFQHTAARRRLPSGSEMAIPKFTVSTHSRPKAAAESCAIPCLCNLFQHTAARRRLHVQDSQLRSLISFNTQPPEGGCIGLYSPFLGLTRFQHTAARRRLHQDMIRHYLSLMFQHTAARRRLPEQTAAIDKALPVSTHSRPKAAADGITYICR